MMERVCSRSHSVKLISCRIASSLFVSVTPLSFHGSSFGVCLISARECDDRECGVVDRRLSLEMFRGGGLSAGARMGVGGHGVGVR